jgi:hypothetical protein
MHRVTSPFVIGKYAFNSVIESIPVFSVAKHVLHLFHPLRSDGKNGGFEDSRLAQKKKKESFPGLRCRSDGNR